MFYWDCLVIGQAIAHYKITAKLGEGGMGEVYRARDTKLNREVALKILPPGFAQDQQRMNRFEREAQLLASLNHPCIAQIYGLEEMAGPETKDSTTSSTKAIVLELVEGETLESMIARGPVPIDRATKIAHQIAEGLDAAHEKGIIHRDLKPANIKITPEEQVKILDFGLAKTLETPGTDLSQSPTISFRSTEAGVILGTSFYMSPEQARGESVDRRTDIWAFGCVLFEMLTGKKAFAGKNITDVFAAIVKEDPDWALLPSELSGRLHLLLRQSLMKEKQRRRKDAGDLAIDLFAASEQLDGKVHSLATGVVKVWPRRLILLSLVTIVSILLALWGLISTPASSPGQPKHLTVSLPENAPLASTELFPLSLGQTYIALSPNGEHLVYVGERENSTLLFLRSLNNREIVPIPGTEGGFSPFFSPDGQWVGYFTGEFLYKVSLEGGDPQPLCEVRNPQGATWGRDGEIFFSDRIGFSVMKVSENGGDVRAVASAHTGLLWPNLLPGGQTLLVSGNPRIQNDILTLEVQTGERRILIEGGSDARYLSSGHILYSAGDSLLAVAFDRKSHIVTGPSWVVLRGIRTELLGAAQYSFSPEGTLAYVSGKMAAIAEPVESDRQGKIRSLGLPPDNYGPMSISPDGQHLAFVKLGVETNIWIRDLKRGVSSRLTLEGNNSYPVWAPDSQSIAFSSDRTGNWELWRKEVVGNEPPERLTVSETRNSPWALSPDGEQLIYSCYDVEARIETKILNLSPEPSPEPLTKSEFLEWGHHFSKNGKWIAYVSDEPGGYEIFVERFPVTGSRKQISSNGGEEPIWSPTKDEIFYRSGPRLMRVTYTAVPELTFSEPELVFEKDFRTVWGRSYDVEPDGEHFLFYLQQEGIVRNQVGVLVGFSEELNRHFSNGS